MRKCELKLMQIRIINEALRKWQLKRNNANWTHSVRVRFGQICKLEQNVSYFNLTWSN